MKNFLQLRLKHFLNLAGLNRKRVRSSVDDLKLKKLPVEEKSLRIRGMHNGKRQRNKDEANI